MAFANTNASMFAVGDTTLLSTRNMVCPLWSHLRAAGRALAHTDVFSATAARMRACTGMDLDRTPGVNASERMV
jgi:hypothetical protein